MERFICDLVPFLLFVGIFQRTDANQQENLSPHLRSVSPSVAPFPLPSWLTRAIDQRSLSLASLTFFACVRKIISRPRTSGKGTYYRAHEVRITALCYSTVHGSDYDTNQPGSGVSNPTIVLLLVLLVFRDFLSLSIPVSSQCALLMLPIFRSCPSNLRLSLHYFARSPPSYLSLSLFALTIFPFLSLILATFLSLSLLLLLR